MVLQVARDVRAPPVTGVSCIMNPLEFDLTYAKYLTGAPGPDSVCLWVGGLKSSQAQAVHCKSSRRRERIWLPDLLPFTCLCLIAGTAHGEAVGSASALPGSCKRGRGTILGPHSRKNRTKKLALPVNLSFKRAALLSPEYASLRQGCSNWQR